MHPIRGAVGTALEAVLLALLLAGPVSAHSTPDSAPDTPLPNASPTGFANFLEALGHSQASNALFRNPTCGAHFGPDGIHPPGNP